MKSNLAHPFVVAIILLVSPSVFPQSAQDNAPDQATSNPKEELTGIKTGEKVIWSVDWIMMSYSKKHDAFINLYRVHPRLPGQPEIVAIFPKEGQTKLDIKNAQLTGIFSGFIELPYIEGDIIKNAGKEVQRRFPYLTDAIVESHK